MESTEWMIFGFFGITANIDYSDDWEKSTCNIDHSYDLKS